MRQMLKAFFVNGKPVKSNYKIKPHDIIQVVLPNPVWDYTVEPENIPLDIIYEDDEVLLSTKSRYGVPSRTWKFSWNVGACATLALQRFTTNNGRYPPGLVHRLDKNTSGIIIIGKTEHALTHLSKQFFDRTIKRHYIALVWGV